MHIPLRPQLADAGANVWGAMDSGKEPGCPTWAITLYRDKLRGYRRGMAVRSALTSLLLTALLAACDKDGIAPEDIIHVSLTPDSAMLLPGDTLDMNALVTDGHRQPLASPVVVWTTSDANVATITSNGRVIARAAGTSRIIATSAGASDTSLVRVGEIRGCDASGVTHTGVIAAETWTALQSPHFIRDSVTVTQKLTIEAGAIVCAHPNASINLAPGTLEAMGRADRRVRFLALDTVTGWRGLRAFSNGIAAGGSIVLDHADVEYANGVVAGFQSSLSIDNSRLRRTFAGTGGANFSSFAIRRSVVEDAVVQFSSGTFEETVIRRGSLSLFPAQPGSGAVRLNGGRIEDSRGIALTIGSTFSFRVPNITVVKPPEIVRSRGGIALMPFATFFALWPTPASQAGLQDNVDRTVNLWSAGSTSLGDLHFGEHVDWKITSLLGMPEVRNLTIDPGTVLIPAPFVRVTGSMTAHGTAAKPITIRCDSASFKCGLTLAGNAPSRLTHVSFVNVYVSAGDSVHLDRINSNNYVAIGAGSSIRNSEIHDVTASFFVPAPVLSLGANVIADRVIVRRVRTPDNSAAIEVRGNNVQLLQCDVVDNANDGVVIAAGANIQVHDCNIENNGAFGLSNLTTMVVDASRNWWGDPAGPNVANASRVSGPVDYSQPLTARRQ